MGLRRTALPLAALFALSGCGATMRVVPFGDRGESIGRCALPTRPLSDAGPVVVRGSFRVASTRARDGIESWGTTPLFVAPGGRSLLAARRGRVFDVDLATGRLRAVHAVGLDPARLASLSEDASMLAVVGYVDGDHARLRVLRTADAQLVLDVPTTTQALHFARPPLRLVADDGVWDLSTGTELWRTPPDCTPASEAPCRFAPLESGAGVIALRVLDGTSVVDVTYFDGRAPEHATLDARVRLHPELDPPIVTTLGRSLRGIAPGAPDVPVFAVELDADVRSVIVAPEPAVLVVETAPVAPDAPEDHVAGAAPMSVVREALVRVIDLATGLERFRAPSGLGGTRIVAASLVTQGPDALERRDLATGEVRSSVRAYAAAISSDGWVVGQRGEVVDPGGRARTEPAAPREEIVHVSRDGAWRLLVDGRVLGDETCLAIRAGYDHAALGASDGRLFLSANQGDGAMTTIDLSRAAPLRSIRASMRGSIFPLPLADAFVFQGSGDENDDELVIVDAPSGDVRRRVQAPRQGYHVVGAPDVPATESEYPGHLWDQRPLELSGERVIVQLHGGRSIDVWDLTRDRSSAHLDAGMEVAVADASDDGTLLAIGSEEGEVRVLRLADDPRELGRVALGSAITSLRIAPDGEHVAIASADGRLRLARVVGGTVIAEIDFDARYDWVTSLTWRGADRLVAYTEREAIVELAR